MNRIQQYREQAKLTRAELGKAIGRVESAVGHYEDCRRTPSLELSRLIVSALNKAGAVCTLDDVFPPAKSKKKAA